MCKLDIIGVKKFNHTINFKCTIFIHCKVEPDSVGRGRDDLFSNFHKVKIWCQYTTRFWYQHINRVTFLTDFWQISDNFLKSFNNCKLFWFFINFSNVHSYSLLCRKWYQIRWLHWIVTKGCIFVNQNFDKLYQY